MWKTINGLELITPFQNVDNKTNICYNQYKV